MGARISPGHAFRERAIASGRRDRATVVRNRGRNRANGRPRRRGKTETENHAEQTAAKFGLSRLRWGRLTEGPIPFGRSRSIVLPQRRLRSVQPRWDQRQHQNGVEEITPVMSRVNRWSRPRGNAHRERAVIDGPLTQPTHATWQPGEMRRVRQTSRCTPANNPAVGKAKRPARSRSTVG